MKFQLTYNSTTKLYELFDQNKTPISQVNLFLQSLQIRGLSPHTVRAYGFDLLALFVWLDDTKKDLKEISTAELVDFISYQKKSNLSPKTINRRLTTTAIFYRFKFGCEISSSLHHAASGSYYKNPGKEQHLGLHNRKRRVSQKLKVKEPKRLIEPLQPNEVIVFLRSLKRYRDLTIVYLMLLCGLRSMEIRDLRWDDISVFEKKLKVRGKGNKERVLPLPDVVLESLGKYRQVEYPKDPVCNFAFVCLQGFNRGQPLRASGVRSLFRYKRKISGIARANPHRFRHTCGADLARQKFDVLRIQKLLGHEHFSTSLQYINLSIEDLTEEYHTAIKKIQKRYGSNHSI
ncbi:MAG: tyrosine-type recombinase/integrase [Bdellovibrionaceae bacterium]|nr:tyrosine-type recombinase/integrase [Pseudobdellovibrionaceae bacterium]